MLRTKKQTIKFKKILKEINKEGRCYIALIDDRYMCITTQDNYFDITLLENPLKKPIHYIVYNKSTNSYNTDELKCTLQLAFLETKYKVAVI